MNAKCFSYPITGVFLSMFLSCAGARRETRAVEIIEAFAQGPENAADGVAGNCASIAAIKVAIYWYGVDGIYAREELADGALRVTLLDSTKVEVSRDQLAQAKLMTRWTRGDGSSAQSLQDRAQEAYAIMAARLSRDFCMVERTVEKQETEACRSGAAGSRSVGFDEALKIMTEDGYESRRGGELLGLGPAMQVLEGPAFGRFFRVRGWLGERQGCVAHSGGHAWFFSQGLVDRDGEAVDSYAFPNWLRRAGGLRMTGAYCIEPPQVKRQATY